jgi:hypothetical protein
MGAKLPESRREPTSMCHSIFRVMLFCLNGVAHDGKPRRNGACCWGLVSVEYGNWS